MRHEIPLPTHGPIKARCRIIARIEAALQRKAGVRMIACSGARSGYRGFLIVEPKVLEAMDVQSRDSLMQSKTVVERILGDLKLTLLKDARRLGEEALFVRYWPKYREPQKTAESAISPVRQFFGTFDDCSSVWTHESNWKKRDS